MIDPLTGLPKEDDPFALPDPLAPPPILPPVLKDNDGDTGGGSARPPGLPPSSPPQQPAMVSPQGFALPEKTERTGWSSTKKQTIADPMAVKAMEEADAAREKQREANQALKTAKVDAALADEQTAFDESEALNARAAQREEQLKLRNTAVNAAMAKTEAARGEMAKAAKMTTYWEDQSWPAKIMSALLIGLGQYAASGKGMNGRNGAWEVFQQAEAADRQKKVANFQNSKELHEAARQGEGAVSDLWKAKVQEWDNQTEIKMKAIGKAGTVLAKRQGVGKAIAEADAFNAAADEKIATDRMKERQRYEVDSSRQNDGGTTTNINKAGAGGDNLTVPGYGVAPDEVTRRKMSDKAAAYEKVKTLTDRLKGANVKADLGSEERQQIDNDLKDLTTAIAIMNNNEGKPSDSDIRNAEKQVGSMMGIGTRAAAAEKFGKPGLDPRTGWKILGERMTEKWRADLKSNLGDGLDKGAYEALGGKKPKAEGRSVDARDVNGKRMIMINGRLKVQE